MTARRVAPQCLRTMFNAPNWANMETATNHGEGMRQGAFGPAFPPLELVTKPNLTTAEAAYYLNRRPQTLRIWAAYESGPLRPRRTKGLLDWPTPEVKRVAGVAA